MENIRKSEKKLKDYYIPNMLKFLIFLKNNIVIKKELNQSIMNLKDEKEIIYYIKLLSNNNSIIKENSNILLNNFIQIINSYKATLENIKNEILNIQKILLLNNQTEIINLFTCNNIEKVEDNNNYKIYINLIELDKKYSKLLRINWNSIEFNDYFKNPENLKKSIIQIYSELKDFI